MNKAVALAVDSRVSLQIPKLSRESLRTVRYSGFSFANTADFSSQLGHISFLADASGSSVPIAFKSYKPRRVTRVAMAGEVILYSDLFDGASTLANDLEQLLVQKNPLQLSTDSKSLFEVISEGSRTSGKNDARHCCGKRKV